MLIWIILNAYGIPTMGEILFPLKVSLPSILKKKKKTIIYMKTNRMGILGHDMLYINCQVFLLTNFRKRRHTCNSTQSPLDTVTTPHGVPIYWVSQWSCHLAGKWRNTLMPACSPVPLRKACVFLQSSELKYNQ